MQVVAPICQSRDPMNSIRTISTIDRPRRPVMRVTFSAALAALVVFGEGITGAGLAQDKSRPSATPSTSQSPGPSSDRSKAPVGHRQPTAQDIPPDVQAREGTRTKEDKALDDALKNICRGC
jgi:hypothetical protein